MSEIAPKEPGSGSGEPQVHGAQLVKMLLEIGPLVVFLVANGLTKNLFQSTGIFMVATVAAIFASFQRFRRVPPMLLVSGVLVLLFGGLTLWTQEAVFIKIKPTVVYMLFATVLLAGLAFGKYYLRMLMGEVFNLTTPGWRLLTMRWACFFVFLAVLNEIVWRNFSDNFWITFKLAGAIPLTVLFGIAQIGLMRRYAEQAPPAA